MSNVSQISDSKLPEQIACLMIPMESATLLLPNEAVAEVVSDLRPEKMPDLPDWCMGEVEWRGLRIPVVSYEQLSHGNEAIPTKDSRLIVLNSVKNDSKHAFYALLSQSAPRLIRAFKDELTEEAPGEGINKHHVSVNVESAIIPDLEMIEENATDELLQKQEKLQERLQRLQVRKNTIPYFAKNDAQYRNTDDRMVDLSLPHYGYHFSVTSAVRSGALHTGWKCDSAWN